MRNEPTPNDRLLAAEGFEAIEKQLRKLGGNTLQAAGTARRDAMRRCQDWDLYNSGGRRCASCGCAETPGAKDGEHAEQQTQAG